MKGLAPELRRHESAGRGEMSDVLAVLGRMEIFAGIDKPSVLLVQRCRTLADNSPRGWNGIYKLETGLAVRPDRRRAEAWRNLPKPEAKP